MKTPPGLEGAVTGFFDPPAAPGVCERGGREDNAAESPSVPDKVGIIFWTSTISWSRAGTTGFVLLRPRRYLGKAS
jgi:hypothetical protein